MKLKFKRRKIETVCTLLFYTLMVFSIILYALYQADKTFDWDIMSEEVQRFIEGLILPTIYFILPATFFISLLINISLISTNIERLADKLDDKKDDDE